jgi:hypothetical protein
MANFPAGVVATGSARCVEEDVFANFRKKLEMALLGLSLGMQGPCMGDTVPQNSDVTFPYYGKSVILLNCAGAVTPCTLKYIFILPFSFTCTCVS